MKSFMFKKAPPNPGAANEKPLSGHNRPRPREKRHCPGAEFAAAGRTRAAGRGTRHSSSIAPPELLSLQETLLKRWVRLRYTMHLLVLLVRR